MNLLIDLSMLRHPYCGLGQVALSYGRWYASQEKDMPQGMKPTLLVPAEWVGKFGGGVDYLQARDIYRFCPQLMPHFEVWHSIHQFSPFRPASRSTRRILTIHDVNFIYEKQGRKRQRYLRRLQRECDSAECLCFISQFALEDASRCLHFGGKPTQVIYNGVADTTRGEQRRPAAVGEEERFLLSLGVVKAKKNLHVLLPMMQRLEGYSLVIAGDARGEYAEQLRAMAEGMSGVRLIGTVSEEERRWLYAHCAGLLFPSVAEGFGLPVVEAMQWGKPVFCSTATSLPEVGGKMAYYFESFEPAAMAEVVACGLSTFGAAEAEAARRRAAQFSLDAHMQTYWRLYGSMLGSELPRVSSLQ
ncbi:MAG: glycosyltransferase family 4 protein [Bacteroidales bacterium]|nr:glycosyltransferase family 4 protein [Bacteroidales bacterium]